jgi:hypothetical protein
VEKQYDTIKELRKQTHEENLGLSQYYFSWQVDTTQTSVLQFKGYEAERLLSEVTGLPRLKYDRTKPFIKETVYRNYYYPKDTITVPDAYVVKKSWEKVMDRLQANNIRYFRLDKDTSLTVNGYKILEYETRKNPYEGHYPHFNTQVTSCTKIVHFNAGDVVIPTHQPGIRYILETLEPQGVDSFFNWNFFDTVLQQKEGFSPYVFEDVAKEMLEKDSVLRQNFMAKKALDTEFSENWYAQLDWLFQQSTYLEDAYLNYPIYRIEKNSEASKILDRD